MAPQLFYPKGNKFSSYVFHLDKLFFSKAIAP